MALPEHVRKMSDGGHLCLHCGGEVDESGNSSMYAESGEEGYQDRLPIDGAAHQKDEDSDLFLKAIKGGR